MWGVDCEAEWRNWGFEIVVNLGSLRRQSVLRCLLKGIRLVVGEGVFITIVITVE